MDRLISEITESKKHSRHPIDQENKLELKLLKEVRDDIEDQEIKIRKIILEMPGLFSKVDKHIMMNKHTQT